MNPSSVCDRGRTSVLLLSASVTIGLWLAANAASAQTQTVRPTTCLMCHTCEIPTKVRPCLVQCPRGQMVTVHHSALAGPDTIRMEKLTAPRDLYGPADFSHRAHAAMSEMSGKCVMCHHYNPPGGVLPCSECHLPAAPTKDSDLSKPGLKGAYHRQCVMCHQEWGGTTQCESCHPAKEKASSLAVATKAGKKPSSAQRPGRMVFDSGADEGKLVTFYHNEHTDLFGLACTDCHANESCAGCHRAKAAPVQAAAHVEQGHDRCTPCHAVDSSCERCHGDEPAAGFSHLRRAGFDLKPYHVSLSCRRCHREAGSHRGLTDDCRTCHAKWESGSFDHRVTGLKLDESHSPLECESCHGERDFRKAPDCSGCHEDKKYPEASPGTRIRSSRAQRS